jgi:UDP-N-acetylmuramyl pentapeptide phosphotransferase/UDP-N-acetylglucosamine-1-phosphate transferase
MSLDLPGWSFILAAFICAFAITWIGIPKVLDLAMLKKLYDLPGERTSHSRPTPRLGGAMIFAGVIISSVIFTGVENSDQLNYVIAGMLILFFIGIKDDIISLTPLKKIIGQFLAAMILVIPGHIRIQHCYGLFGLETLPSGMSIIFTILIVVTLINSMNLIDGIDGLASGVGILASLIFGLWFYINDYLSFAVICASLTGSLIAFFYFNVFGREKKIFLGDTGSMLIGFLLAVNAINFLEKNAADLTGTGIEVAPSITLAILVLPVFDIFRIIFVRLLNRKSIFKADNNHIHHNLLRISNSHLKTTTVLLTINLAVVILTYLFRSLGNIVLLSAIAGLCTILSFYLFFYLKKNDIH